MKILLPFSLSLIGLWTSPLRADTRLRLEGGLASFARNDARIPGNSGTLVDIAAWTEGSVGAQRVYLGHTWSERHEVRVLWAPLSATAKGRPDTTLSFQGQNFSAAQDTEAFYKFNSYRVTYAYHFENSGPWHWALGFTAKIRDAEIRLTQGALSASKKNVGFVPLLNLQARRDFGSSTALVLDVDGMAAPQGRAIDAALMLQHTFLELGSAGSYSILAGYRSIEGGADNDTVYNFAWIKGVSDETC
jgi:hypothetical protein